MRVLVLFFVLSYFPFVQQLAERTSDNPPFSILREVPLTIHSEKPATMSIHVYNVSGEQVLYVEENLSEPGVYLVDFDWSSLASGIYYAYVSDGQQSLLTKIIIR